MDWLNKNYERVLLAIGIAILLVSAFCIFQRAVSFQSQFTELQSHPIERRATPPGKARDVDAALQKLHQPPQWTFSGRSGLFVPEKHFIGTDGQPATLQTTEVHPPVPNEWIEQFGLPIADPDVLDPAGDAGVREFGDLLREERAARVRVPLVPAPALHALEFLHEAGDVRRLGEVR